MIPGEAAQLDHAVETTMKGTRFEVWKSCFLAGVKVHSIESLVRSTFCLRQNARAIATAGKVLQRPIICPPPLQVGAPLLLHAYSLKSWSLPVGIGSRHS